MKRPQVLEGKTVKLLTGCGAMYVSINKKDGKPFEVFARLGKAGGCSSSNTEALGRLVSLCLQNKIKIEDIIDDLRGISCQSAAWSEDGKSISSCADALGIALAMELEEEKEEKEEKKTTKQIDETTEEVITVEQINKTIGVIKNMTNSSGGGCPDCGATLIYAEGCLRCSSCMYTKC